MKAKKVLVVVSGYDFQIDRLVENLEVRGSVSIQRLGGHGMNREVHHGLYMKVVQLDELLVMERAITHELESFEIRQPTLATYKCACGATGLATLPDFLTSVLSIEDRVKNNHGLHAVRARMKAEKEAGI